MRILIWIVLPIVVVATLSGQAGKGTQAPARSATLSADIQPDSLNRLSAVKREQMDENMPIVQIGKSTSYAESEVADERIPLPPPLPRVQGMP